jgi:hypothetical protein
MKRVTSALDSANPLEDAGRIEGPIARYRLEAIEFAAKPKVE